jgi:hypothetical protein
MTTAIIQSIKSRLLKALRLFIFSLLFSLLFVQLSMGSALAQSQLPATPLKSLEGQIDTTTRAEKPVPQKPTQPVIPQARSSPDTAKRDRAAFQRNRPQLGDGPVDPYKPYYNDIEKFNEEVYGEKG